MAYVTLVLAILCEVVGTLILKSTDGFTRVGPTSAVFVAYAASFYLLSLTLRTVPVGTAYAVWSGLGTAAIAVLGWKIYGQVLDAAAIAGIALIVAGVLVLNLVSKTMVH